MSLSNFAFDLADERAEQERNSAIARASATVTAQGALICIDCDEEISVARRTAYPAAQRCVECQETYELWLKRRKRL